MGDHGDRDLKRTKTNTKTKKLRKTTTTTKNSYAAVLKILFHAIKIQWHFFQELPLYFFLFLLFCFVFLHFFKL